jgi:hypothetical protein
MLRSINSNLETIAGKFSGGLIGGLNLVAITKQTKYQVFKRAIRFPSPAPNTHDHVVERSIEALARPPMLFREFDLLKFKFNRRCAAKD